MARQDCMMCRNWFEEFGETSMREMLKLKLVKGTIRF